MKRISVLAGLLASLVLTATASAGNGTAPGWHVGYYNASGQALSFAQANKSNAGIAALNFTDEANTALLVTDQKAQFGSLLGDLSGDTNISATFTISGATGAFTYWGEPDGCGAPASARLFFETSNAGGFDETHYWWSNPSSAVLANGTFTVTASTSGADWSDYYGHFGSDPSYAAGFQAALSHVTEIGLSFGGGCFFENGVATADGSGTLVLDSYTAS